MDISLQSTDITKDKNLAFCCILPGTNPVSSLQTIKVECILLKVECIECMLPDRKHQLNLHYFRVITY